MGPILNLLRLISFIVFKKPDPLPIIEEKKEASIEHKKVVVSKTPLPKWYEIAQKELGVSEKSPGDNPRIVEYHSKTTLKASTDEVPWCASFVSWCLEKAGYDSTRSALARSYLKYGAQLSVPTVGCIVVFRRGMNKSSGHVAFYVSETEKEIYVLGGNQSNKVCVKKYLKSDLLDYRWPIKEL